MPSSAEVQHRKQHSAIIPNTARTNLRTRHLDVFDRARLHAVPQLLDDLLRLRLLVLRLQPVPERGRWSLAASKHKSLEETA